jgi:signal transduction histidine kinase
MTNPITYKNHPFPFLIYLEWILLGGAALVSLLPSPLQRLPRFPEITICSLVIFGLMGLRLPRNNRVNKVLYTACEVFLILVTGFFGGKTARLFPFLYLILVTRSCLIFSPPGRMLVTFTSFILFIITLKRRLPNVTNPYLQDKFLFFNINLVTSFGLSLLFVLLLMNAIVRERESREKLTIANNKLKDYALRVENQATLEERNRIAREIHDSLGHSLTALNLQLETSLKLWQSNPERAYTFLDRAKELGSKALHDVRQSVSAMRYNPLEEKSLQEAIGIIVQDFQNSTSVTPICEIQISSPLSNEINTVIYRIIQESLTNIYKYANASEVKIEISTISNALFLQISDNGRGFDISQNTTGFGLQSMRDRTLAVDGHFQLKSSPANGCQIIVNIPT